MSHCLSFCILDQTSPVYGPVHVNLPSLLDADIHEGVSALLNVYQERPDNLWSYIFTNPPVGLISDHLSQWHHYVYYQWDSPYIVAFTINYTRFELLGGDMIRWRENDEYDPIAVRGHPRSSEPEVPCSSGPLNPRAPPCLSPSDV